MKNPLIKRLLPVGLCLGGLVGTAPAQEQRPPAPAAVSGIQGVKEEAAAKIKNIETGTTAAPKNTAQGVNKIDGINTVNGVKADGRTVVVPPPPLPKSAAPPPPPPPATAVSAVQGVKEEAAAKIKNVETGTMAAPKNTAQGVNKIDGINTVNGVKADGRTVVIPPPPVPKAVAPPPPPPPPTARPVPPPIVGTAVNVAVGTVGNGAIRPVTGVTGINAAKLQNLEVALQVKQGPDNGNKGKAAAAALLGGQGPGPKPGPKADGRAGFQEFEKLPNSGS